jgi:hypothetical protein
VPEILVAEVRFSDTDKENDVLRTRFQLQREQYPELILFKTDNKGEISSRTFYGAEFTTDEIKRFLRHKTGLVLTLPGCNRSGKIRVQTNENNGKRSLTFNYRREHNP